MARKEATLVVRLPTELLVEIDQLRGKLSRAQGERVSRSLVVRQLLERGLGTGGVRPEPSPAAVVQTEPALEKDWDKLF